MKLHRKKQKPEPASMREYYKSMGVCYYYKMQGSCPYRHCRFLHIPPDDSPKQPTRSRASHDGVALRR